MRPDRRMWRAMQWLLGAGLAVILVMALWPVLRAFASASASNIQLDASACEPRQVEDTTQAAIVRDYGRAWDSFRKGLGNDDATALNNGFIGVAHDKLADQIEAQRKAGLTTRYLDKGHKVQAVFYSPDGSAIELHDTAQVEMEVLDGGSVVRTENLTLHYVALMTTAEDRWKVRVFEAVPGF